VRLLRDRNFDVLAIAEVNPGMSDSEVMALAHSEQRWLLTFDLDFGELAFRSDIPLPPAIVLIRSDWDFTELVIQATVSERATLGGFFVLDARGMRWRPFGSQTP
jgi:predicted nuclease of predicted toxin-antitoxin system